MISGTARHYRVHVNVGLEITGGELQFATAYGLLLLGSQLGSIHENTHELPVVRMLAWLLLAPVVP